MNHLLFYCSTLNDEWMKHLHTHRHTKLNGKPVASTWVSTLPGSPTKALNTWIVIGLGDDGNFANPHQKAQFFPPKRFRLESFSVRMLDAGRIVKWTKMACLYYSYIFYNLCGLILLAGLISIWIIDVCASTVLSYETGNNSTKIKTGNDKWLFTTYAERHKRSLLPTITF